MDRTRRTCLRPAVNLTICWPVGMGRKREAWRARCETLRAKRSIARPREFKRKFRCAAPRASWSFSTLACPTSTGIRGLAPPTSAASARQRFGSDRSRCRRRSRHGLDLGADDYKEQIAQQLVNYDDALSLNTVEVYVSRLRSRSRPRASKSARRACPRWRWKRPCD